MNSATNLALSPAPEPAPQELPRQDLQTAALELRGVAKAYGSGAGRSEVLDA